MGYGWIVAAARMARATLAADNASVSTRADEPGRGSWLSLIPYMQFTVTAAQALNHLKFTRQAMDD
jgi:hypothetical protein